MGALHYHGSPRPVDRALGCKRSGHTWNMGAHPFASAVGQPAMNGFHPSWPDTPKFPIESYSTAYFPDSELSDMNTSPFLTLEVAGSLLSVAGAKAS